MRVSAYRGAFFVYEYPADFYRFVMVLPGFHKWLNAETDRDEEGFMFGASARHLELFQEHYPDVPIRDRDGTLAKLTTVLAPVEPVERSFPFGGPLAVAQGAAPWEHQNRALSQAISREAFAFFHDTGTGKTATMLQIVVEQWAREMIDRTLVITTALGLIQLRDEQIPYWMPEGVRYRVAEVGDTVPPKSFFADDGALLIGLTKPGSFQSQRMVNNILEFVRGYPLSRRDGFKFEGRGKVVPA